MPAAYRYSQWDDSQLLQGPDSSDILNAMSDDLMHHGDISRALRQLMQRGFSSDSGARLTGVQDLLKRLRERRQQMLGQHDLDSVYDDLRQRVDEITQMERDSIQQRLDALDSASQAAGPELRGVFERMARKNLAALDALPESLPERVQGLKDYEFLDPEAGRRFQDLLQSLQKSVLDSFFRDLTESLQRIGPEDLARIRDMATALNQMLQRKIRGERPDFDGFMQQYGDMLGPDAPQSLDELVNRMQRQVTQMQSLLNSLSREQRESLLDLLSSQLFDARLQQELADLATNLDILSPSGLEGEQYRFFGEETTGLQQAMELMEQLDEMERLERHLDRTRFGADIRDVDREAVENLLGPEAARQLEELKRIAHSLEEEGYLKRDGDGLKLTARGIRKIGEKALRDIFEGLRKDTFGEHQVKPGGGGLDPEEHTKRYEFGDAFHLDLKQTLFNAVQRGAAGVPVRLAEQDFEVRRTEGLTRTTTVLMLDLSRSMPMRGNFLAAKKVALALNSLIRNQYPRDTLYLVGFSGFAREVEDGELPRLNVGDFGRGTNMQAGLQVARKLLSRHRGCQRQVILITDGEPTAYYESDGRLYIEFPPSPRVLRETLKEVNKCTREGITINTFMLEKSYHLRTFVSQLAKVNRGRVLFTSPEKLGQYLLVDYVGRKNRRAYR